MNAIKLRLLRSDKGSMTTEFLMVIGLFLFTISSCAEIVRLLYISARLDLAVSEAAKSAKNTVMDGNTSYQEVFQKKLLAQQGVFDTFITANNSASVNVYFSNNVSEVASNSATNNLNTIYNNETLARYTVSYLYRPLFFPIPSLWANTLLRREVIFVQES